MNPMNEEKLTRWKKLIEEKTQSRLLIKDFCKEKNITPAQFYYYRAMVNGGKKTTRIKNENSNVKPIQIIHSNQKEQNAIRFILPNGLQCIFPRGIPAQEIKNILEAWIPC